jgi:hypothetical protein
MGDEMSERDEARFAERFDRYCTKLKELGVPIEVWKEVLVELYFPVDWANEPAAFTELGHELENSRGGAYDLTRPDGMSDHDYAVDLLQQSQKRIDGRKARVAATFDPALMQEPPDDEEDDSDEVTDWVKWKTVN